MLLPLYILLFIHSPASCPRGASWMGMLAFCLQLKSDPWEGPQEDQEREREELEIFISWFLILAVESPRPKDTGSFCWVAPLIPFVPSMDFGTHSGLVSSAGPFHGGKDLSVPLHWLQDGSTVDRPPALQPSRSHHLAVLMLPFWLYAVSAAFPSPRPRSWNASRFTYPGKSQWLLPAGTTWMPETIWCLWDTPDCLSLYIKMGSVIWWLADPISQHWLIIISTSSSWSPTPSSVESHFVLALELGLRVLSGIPCHASFFCSPTFNHSTAWCRTAHSHWQPGFHFCQVHSTWGATPIHPLSRETTSTESRNRRVKRASRQLAHGAGSDKPCVSLTSTHEARLGTIRQGWKGQGQRECNQRQ